MPISLQLLFNVAVTGTKCGSKPGMVSAYLVIPALGRQEGSGVPRQPQLHRECEASLSYMRPCLKKANAQWLTSVIPGLERLRQGDCLQVQGQVGRMRAE